MRRILFSIITGAVLLAPTMALAVTLQEFTFIKGEINADWRGIGPVTMQQLQDGIVLTANGTGAILTDTALEVLPQAAILTTDSKVPLELSFVWINGDDPQHVTNEIPIAVAAGTNVQTPFALAKHSQWHAGKKTLGLAFPPGATITVKNIKFVQWGFWGKAVELVKSFWTFDSYTPYSINFVRGPFLANNPVQRSILFQGELVNGSSGTILLLAGTLLALAALAGWQYRKRMPAGHRKRSAVLLLLALWIAFDLRMGLEFLSWIKTDLQTYTFASEGSRTFRDRGRFYDFAAFAAPLVADRESYLFFAQQMWPYLGNMRYLTYPSIPGNRLDKDDTSVIYDRSDIVVDAQHQLTLDGEVFSPPGRILGRFDDSSFVFRIGQ